MPPITPGSLTANTDYYLYVYRGINSYQHGFKTLNYKTSLADYAAALPGSKSRITYNNGLDRISVKGYIERKAAEPAVYNMLFGPGTDGTNTLTIEFGSTNLMFCTSGGCVKSMTLLYFSDSGNYFPGYTVASGQADWLVFNSNYNSDGTIKTLESPAIFQGAENQFTSSMTYKTVTE